MKSSFLVKACLRPKARGARGALVVAWAALLLGGCSRPSATAFQGYLEGEFVYIAAPLAGRLDRLSIEKGAHVETGAPLFSLDAVAEQAAQREADERLRLAEARLADLRKGSRDSELAAIEARLAQARAAAQLSALEADRQKQLLETRAVSVNDYDRARLNHERNQRAVDELAAQLATARLGGRPDALAAAEAEVGAARAALARADWNVSQKNQAAPRAGLIYDTLFREGEFVVAGQPVVALLPPENLKVRFFVPEEAFASLKAGDIVHVAIASRSAPVDARVAYLSPKPEYTPPVLYNRENRAKLLFMVEALLPAEAARELHPGQPVDVTPAPKS